MRLVILAAGHGRRFGGLKQLEPVGPDGQAIMDYSARSAADCGFDGVVLVVREEIRREIERHVRRRWPSSLHVALECQGPPSGTAQAVLSARPSLDGPFAVANADDLYGDAAIRLLARHFSAGIALHAAVPSGEDVRDHHLLVDYQLARTVHSSDAVKRGLCEVEAGGRLRAIVEHVVRRRDDGSFEAAPLHDGALADQVSGVGTRSLGGDERTSMNLWGFHPRMLGHLDTALAVHARAASADRELLLPDVVGDLVSSGADRVHVVRTTERCVGITHRSDATMVAGELSRVDAVPAREAL